MSDTPQISLSQYLTLLGVAELPPLTSPLDPGYDPATTEGHLEQSGHLMDSLKISMACWQIGAESAVRRKLAAARKAGVKTCTGGGPFEVAFWFDKFPEFLELCASLQFDRIEAGEGFISQPLDPREICAAAAAQGLEVQFEVGEKQAGSFTDDDMPVMIDQSKRWLDAGAAQIIVEGRESALDVGLFDRTGQLNRKNADRFVEALSFERVVFEAPNKSSQFAFLNHFGPNVRLSNVRLEEVLRVEIYRRGLHSDAFQHENLRPKGPAGR
jgi:phosphosulfolactate synthase